MKKIIVIAVSAIMAAMLLTACGGSGKDQQTTAANETTTAAADTTAAETQAAAAGGKYVFTYKGTDIVMKADAAPILEALGEPKSHTEETSCAFDGLDKNNVYSSFIVTTYPDGDVDRINSVVLLDDTVSTNDGICIGDSTEKVEEVYGSDCFDGVNAYIMSEGDAQLSIIMESDKVYSIQYLAVFD